ncbi:MAG: hypothetical protein QF701_02785 [Nitrospinota bacterium]|nr:hypothetical protein [Nitrospinota bacterium]MDP7166675.1 hypothetical protein [Nitrospinota bacterium]MDP7504261.1 hypothetical protein [Nitrospinota bacterium]MDP7662759.1 hypothetical protein [Nitrospinota bacterium]
MIDWLREALNGNVPAGHEKIAYVHQSSETGPFGSPLPEDHPRRW